MHGLNQDYHNLLNFELAGKKTFFFNDNLTDHLIATELSVDAELVRTQEPSKIEGFRRIARTAIMQNASH